MLYEVRAADAASQLRTLQVEASSVADARQHALRLRLTPVSIKPRHRGERAQRQRFDLSLFAEELQMLLSAGLPLIDAIDGLAERQSEGETRSVFTALASRLRNGESLSAAMARQPEVFPPLFIGIVHAADATSDLSSSLAKYVAYESHLKALRERMTSAAIYPLILLVVGSAVTLFLMTYVVPRFATVYESSGRSLPWVSQALLDVGRLLSQNLVPGLVVLLAAAVLGWRWYRPRRQAMGWLKLLGLLPGAASRVATIEVSRLYRTLGMLLDGGLPLREALVLSDAVVFADRRRALVEALRKVEGGEPLWSSLEQATLCTPLALRLIRVGEQSGQLGRMLERAAMFHEHETALWIERFSKTFGPVLMILISLIVGMVVIFLYIPVFDLAGSLQ